MTVSREISAVSSWVPGIILLSIIFAGCAEGDAAAGYTLTWIAPIEYEDGSPLWNLAGVRIYRNGAMVLDVSDPSRVWAEIDGESGDIVWITAYDARGAESGPSDNITLP